MTGTPREQFQDILHSFSSAMLVTKTLEGQLRARPMVIAQCESDADLWFVTDAESGKIDELKEDARVAVTMQNASRFLSLSGKATVSRDKQQVETLWQDRWRAWFPGGVDDGNLVVVHIAAEHGEYWDASSLKGWQYVFATGKALLQNDSPHSHSPEHGEVDFVHR